MGGFDRTQKRILTLYIIQTGKKNSSLFNDDQDRTFLINLIKHSSIKHKIKILAYVLLKNQYTLLLQASNNILSQFIHHIHSGYANYFNRHHQTKHRPFGDHYKHFIIDEKNYLAEVSYYLHLLPNIKKEAKSLLRYRWSSLPGYINHEYREDWIDHNFILNHINGEGGDNLTAYKTNVIRRMRKKMKSPFTGLKRGEILGDDEFKHRIQEKLDLEKSLPSQSNLSLPAKIKEAVNQEQCFTSREARNAAIYLINKYTDLSNQDISLLFKPLKKSSISKMSQRYRNFYETEPSIREAADRLEDRIKEIALKEYDIELGN